MSQIDRLPRYVAIKLVKQEQHEAFVSWAVDNHGRESELRDELLQPASHVTARSSACFRSTWLNAYRYVRFPR